MTETPVAYELHYPDFFDEVEWDTRQRGYFIGVTLSVNGRTHELSFFDPVRLEQDITRTLEREIYFTEKNIIVIAEVDREHMEDAVGKMSRHAFRKLA